MRTRGIPLTEAKALLTEAFIGEALSVIENDEIENVLMGHFAKTIRQS